MEIKEKQLLFTDRNAQQELQKDVEKTQQRANSLIRLFESFQPWVKVTTPEIWMQLVSDPAKFYDDALLSHTNLSAGGLMADPSVVAKLFSLNRDGFIGEKAISLHEWNRVEKFLLFQNGVFEINNTALQLEKEKYKIYIENEEQQEVVSHWTELCRVLNEHHEKSYIGRNELQQIAMLCKFRFVPDTGKVYINEENIRFEILKLRR
jgi:hypothetical protein